jgi:putative endonuclease
MSKAAKGGRVEPPWFYSKEIMWHVYILRCKDGSLYTGSTTDICRRIKEHNSSKGGSYTRIRHPVRLIYKEIHLNRSNAQSREAQIKKWTKKKKLAFISHNKSLLKQSSKSRD